MTTSYQPNPISKSNANIIVDSLACYLYDAVYMRATALVSAMMKRLGHDETVREQLEQELEELSSGYHKYLDVMEQLKAHDRSIERLKAIVGIGAAPGEAIMYMGAQDPEDAEAEAENRQLRRRLELWEAVEQYLRFVPEAKIRDILDFMEMVNIRTSRQAVEAAIKAHSKVFRVQKKKQEKFVSLK